MPDQLKLFVPPPGPDPYGTARRLIPAPHNRTDTSEQAAKKVRQHGPTMRQRVLNHLAAQAGRGATIEEVSTDLGMRLQTVCGRVSELRKLGLIEDSGKRRSTESGRPAIVWVARGGGTR